MKVFPRIMYYVYMISVDVVSMCKGKPCMGSIVPCRGLHPERPLRNLKDDVCILICLHEIELRAITDVPKERRSFFMRKTCLEKCVCSISKV